MRHARPLRIVHSALCIALALASASTRAAVTFHEYMTVTGSGAAQGVRADTGYTPGSGTIVRAKYSMNGSQTMNLFCARSGVTAGQYVFFCQVSGKVRWDFDTQAGQTTGAKTVATTTATTYEIEVRNGVLRMWQNDTAFDTVTPSTAGNSFTAAARMFLLQSYGANAGATPDSNPGWGNSFHGRFHYLAIIEVENGAEVLKHSFVPCVEDGTVKLYDLVEEKTVALATTSGGGVNVTGAPVGLDPTVPTHASDRKVKVVNFDEDLATVYVNGEPATNGAIFTVANGASVALTLGDFQSDWYFAYAPPSQTDRTLALDFWGGLPAEAASNQNPCAFIPREYLTTVTPNVDCKGYVWYAVDANAAISNSTYKIAASSFNATKRTLTAGAYSAYYGGDKVMDLAMRVRKDGINHTVTYLNGGFSGQPSTVRVPRRLTGWGHSLTAGCGGKTMTFVGLQESAVTVVEGYAFYNTYCKVYGAMTNYMPHGALTIGSGWAGNTFYGQAGLTGPLLLPCVTTIYAGSFNGCSGLTELYSTSPKLTTINSKAFYGTSKMRKVTLASPVLSSVAGDAFNSAITNFTYLSAPPASQLPLDNVLAGVTAADGAHDLRVYLPLCTPGWWDLVSEPTAAEVAAGLPDGCYGVYVTAADARKGWIVASDDVDASLVVTDMTQDGNSGYTIHSGLAQGDRLTLSREGFTACDLQHFNRATGAWETFETKRASSFEYVHDGQLTRAKWKIDGYALFFTSNRYGGSITVSGATPIAGDNIYAPGAVLTVTATGRADHPTSHFTVWTAGVSGEATNSATITLTMDADKSLAADFDPDEWLYDATAKTITDGEYTSSAVTLDATTKAVAVPNFSGGQNYMLWLDLSLPVFVPSYPDAEYAITSFGIGGNSTFRKIRFGERFTAFTGDRPFSNSLIIERLDNLGHTQMKVFPYCFTHNGPANAPLHLTTKYEANDYIPETLVEVKDLWYTGGPYLVGTLRLPNFTTYGGACNTYSAFSTRTAGVTNLYLTCEALSNLAVSTDPAGNLFHGMALQELTIGSTNLVAAKNGAFSGAATTLERMNFLAHAPTASALNNILASYNARTTSSAKPLRIHCSKHAPGWRELKAEVDKSSAEWLSRPEGTWGIYQTAANKRFYLVQRDSKYDTELQTIIFLR